MVIARGCSRRTVVRDTWKIPNGRGSGYCGAPRSPASAFTTSAAPSARGRRVRAFRSPSSERAWGTNRAEPLRFTLASTLTPSAMLSRRPRGRCSQRGKFQSRNSWRHPVADIDYDRLLGECEQRYRKSRQQKALRIAVGICERCHVPEPEWLRAALYRLGRDTVTGVVKSPEGGRPNKRGRDLSYCEEIEDYIS